MFPTTRRFVLLAAAAVGGLFANDVQACTSIMVGCKASADGSVMTSHTCDGHGDQTSIFVVPTSKHPAGSVRQLSKRQEDNTGRIPHNARAVTGSIPEAPETFDYLAPIYAAMNERQTAKPYTGDNVDIQGMPQQAG